MISDKGEMMYIFSRHKLSVIKVIFCTVTVFNCKRNRPNSSHLLYAYS